MLKGLNNNLQEQNKSTGIQIDFHGYPVQEFSDFLSLKSMVYLRNLKVEKAEYPRSEIKTPDLRSKLI